MSGRLTSTIKELAQGIGAGSFRSEAEISQGVVKRVLHELEWPVFNVQVVAPEFRIGARKVDYALCHPAGKPAVLVEVKDLGKADGKGQKQLFEYCFHQGVPIAVLTDGRKWSFFFPSGQGSYEERRFARIDLVEGDSRDSAETLRRYLARNDVSSGEARKRAEGDYEAARFQKEAASRYAAVWRRLVSGPEPLLLDLFAEEVENETGVQPDRERAAEFIREQVRASAALLPQPEPAPRARQRAVPSRSRATDGEGAFSLTFRGQAETFTSAADVFAAVFHKLASMDPQFCRRYSERHYGRVRPYMAKSKDLLYPGHSRSADARPLPGGWWLATRCQNDRKVRRIRQACRVAGLEFGQDVIVRIPVGPR